MPTLIYWIRRARARFGLALAVVSLGLAAPALAGGSEQMLKACFEVQAARAMDNARTPDELTRNLAAMAAGKLCHEAVANAVHACLADVEDGRVRRVQSYYRCIGRAANICIDSKWATDEFRRVVCADAEEAAWLAMMQADLEAMKPMLAGGPDEDLLRGMEATHFAARDAACGLARHVNEKTGPHIGYAACAAEMAGRFAIDARVLRRTLAAAKRQKQQERPPFNGPGDASGLGLVSKATAHAIGPVPGRVGNA